MWASLGGDLFRVDLANHHRVFLNQKLAQLSGSNQDQKGGYSLQKDHDKLLDFIYQDHISSKITKIQRELEEIKSKEIKDFIQEGQKLKRALPNSQLYKQYGGRILAGDVYRRSHTQNFGLLKAPKILQFLEQKHRPLYLWFFKEVDPIQEQLPQYYRIIKRPISLSKIKRKLKKHSYQTYIEFQMDMLLLVNNSYLYNHGNKEMQDQTKKFHDAFLRCQKKFFSISTLYQADFRQEQAYEGTQYLDEDVELDLMNDHQNDSGDQQQMRRQFDEDWSYPRQIPSSQVSSLSHSKKPRGRPPTKKKIQKVSRNINNQQKGFSKEDIRSLSKTVQQMIGQNGYRQENRVLLAAIKKITLQSSDKNEPIQLQKCNFEQIREVKGLVSEVQSSRKSQKQKQQKQKNETPQQQKSRKYVLGKNLQQKKLNINNRNYEFQNDQDSQ